jgi:hypothetical protein
MTLNLESGAVIHKQVVVWYDNEARISYIVY